MQKYHHSTVVSEATFKALALWFYTFWMSLPCLETLLHTIFQKDSQHCHHIALYVFKFTRFLVLEIRKSQRAKAWCSSNNGIIVSAKTCLPKLMSGKIHSFDIKSTCLVKDLVFSNKCFAVNIPELNTEYAANSFFNEQIHNDIKMEISMILTFKFDIHTFLSQGIWILHYRLRNFVSGLYWKPKYC